MILDNIQFGLSVLMGFVAIMNPIGNVPIFIGLTSDATKKERKVIAFRSTLLAFLIVILFILFGSEIFNLFGISLESIQIAGSILIFLVGYQLLHGRNSRIHHPDNINDGTDSEEINLAISPLAIPILAGPGTISTALSFSAQADNYVKEVIVVIGFALICIATYISFISADKILNFLKESVITVITRLMGLLLTIIAAQMLITGVQSTIGKIS